MTFDKARIARITMTALSCAALTLTMSRCSPLSLSVSKQHTTPGTTGTGPGTQVGPVDGPTEIESQAKPISRVQASVHEAQESDKETAQCVEAEQCIKITADSDPKAFAAFKANRAIEVGPIAVTPDKCKAYLGLSLSENEIANLGLNSGGDKAIATDCVPAGKGYWNVSVSDNVTADAWDQLAPSVQSVTIFMAVSPKLQVATNPPATPGNLPGKIAIPGKPPVRK
jgi:hypothetical protein